MSEKRCESCGTESMGEQIGQFLDFDADANHGSIGVPLCCSCLGTGIELIDNTEFTILSEEVRKLRTESHKIQCEWSRLLKEKTEKVNWRIMIIKSRVDEINARLTSIAGRALEIVPHPIEKCFAENPISE